MSKQTQHPQFVITVTAEQLEVINAAIDKDKPGLRNRSELIRTALAACLGPRWPNNMPEQGSGLNPHK